MKKLTTLATALLLGSASQAALAGDWNGLYAGLSLGEGTHTTSALDNDYYYYGGTQEFNSKALTYGLQGGINHQKGSLVLGAELSYTFTDNEDALRYDTNVRVANELNSVLSLRGRAGLAVDNALVYMTLGVAQMDAEHDWNDGVNDRFRASTDGLGAIYGIGVEAKLNDQMSVRGEFLNAKSPNEAGKSINGDQFTFTSEYSSVSIGANFLF